MANILASLSPKQSFHFVGQRKICRGTNNIDIRVPCRQRDCNRQAVGDLMNLVVIEEKADAHIRETARLLTIRTRQMRKPIQCDVNTVMLANTVLRQNPEVKSLQRRIAVFDLDRTITRKGTYSSFLLYAARHLNPVRLALIPAVIIAMAGYKLRLMSRTHLKEIMHHLMLGQGVAQHRIQEIAGLFAERTLRKNVYALAIELIESERNAGALIVIASAAHHYYLNALGEKLNADFVIGTESVWIDGFLSSQIVGQNCYGLEKQRRMANFLRVHSYKRGETFVCFYSDDLSDLPSFQFADEAVATNPSRKLAGTARKSKWKILDWRL
jgi:HAD superfamily hydrolase (TIGR01490 family)